MRAQLRQLSKELRQQIRWLRGLELAQWHAVCIRCVGGLNREIPDCVGLGHPSPLRTPNGQRALIVLG